MNTPSRHSHVLLVDVVDSSAIAGFPALRDRTLGELSARHGSRGSIAADYTVTAWDEFQTVIPDAGSVPQVLLEIRQAFAPREIYAAIGSGSVSGWQSDQPINETLSGEGFTRARAAMDALKAGRGDKYRRLSRFVTGDEARDALLNLIYGLHDSLVQQITGRQWETIGAALSHPSQEEVARALGVRPSTVTRNLKRGHYWQMRETAALASVLLGQDAGMSNSP